MNPEFQRNLYLEFSVARLIGMPLALLVIFALSYVMNQNQFDNDTANVALWLYIFIVVFWGARQAGESIYDELRNRTWDIQKTSALSPWSLTWGKLFGSTLFNWYGGFFCLLVYLISKPPSENVFLISGYALVGGLLIHALSLLVALFALRKKQPINASISYLFVFFLLFFIFAVNINFKNHAINLMHWYNFEIEHPLFVLISLALVCGWSIVGIYRLLAQELQIRTLPWVWLLFIGFWIVYIHGLLAGNHLENTFAQADEFANLNNLVLVSMAFCATLSYGFMLIDNHNPMLLRRLWLYAQEEKWQRFLEEIPCWLISLVLVLPASLYLSVFFQFETSEAFHFYPLPAFLLLLRDVAIVLFFNYSPNPKRALGLSLLSLTFLYWIIPAIFVEAGATAVAGVFLPFFSVNIGLAMLFAAGQVGIIGYWLFQRWQKTLNYAHQPAEF